MVSPFYFLYKDHMRTHEGLDIRSASPVDSRFIFDTVAEMRAFDRDLIPPGCITYCKETLSHYTYITFEGQGLKGWRKLIDDRPTIQVVSETDFEENLWRIGGNVVYWVVEDGYSDPEKSTGGTITT